jgi:pyrimidine-specific ribonucleoside hydrolase
MATTESPQKIWIDTDIIFNKPGQEVDDGLALMMAFNNENIDIKGISLIHNVNNGYQVTKKLRGFYGNDDIPIYKGTDDATKGAGTKTKAVDALAKALEENELTIVAIGPATNIANLLEFYPEAAKNIKDIVFCAGRNRGEAFTTEGSPVGFPDYNFEIDPASFKKVIESDLHVTLSGYEASSSVFLYRDDLEKIGKNGRKGDEWVYQQLQPWITKWEEGLDIKGFIPFDCSTIGHVLYPDYFEYHRDISVTVNRRKNDSPSFSDVDEKPYLEVSYDIESPQTVDFVHTAKQGYKKVVMQNLLGNNYKF